MPRVALVTGGTRGIGASICKALKKTGYQVAANYAGNETAAVKFRGRDRHSGLQVGRQFIRGLCRGREGGRHRSRPSGRTRQQRRDYARRDAPSHEARAVDGGDQHQSQFPVQHVPAGDRSHARTQIRSHHQRLVDQRSEGTESGKRIILRQKPAISGLPKRWPRKMPATVSP